MSQTAKQRVSAGPPAGTPQWQGTDAELFAQLRRPHALVLSHLYDRFAPDINRVVWKLLGGDADHNDLVHDVFIKVMTGAHRLRDPEKLASWVVAVAVNTVYKELRRRRVRAVWPWGREERAEPSLPHPDYEGRELVRRIYDLLAGINAKDRLAFSLRYLDDRTVPEIAALCGWSEATVKRAVKRAWTRFVKLSASDPELARRLGGAPEEGEA